MTGRTFSGLRRAAAAGTALLLGAVLSAPGAVAQPVPSTSGSLGNIGACIADKGVLDVIVMIDETESLIHEARGGMVNPDAPGADAEHNRVPAAQSFIRELLNKQSGEGFRTNVRVSGFGQGYRSGATDPDNYGAWTQLSDSSLQGTLNEIGEFADRTSEQYTNYAAAIDGAYRDFSGSGSGDSCRMLVTFTDGAMTAQEGADVAQEALCAPGGVTDRLRAAGITHIGIGLSSPDNPSDFTLLQAISEGATGTDQCGVEPPDGAFFTADNVGGLFAAFREALATGGGLIQETRAGDPFRFTLDNSVDSVRFSVIAKDDLGPDAQLVLVAPDGGRTELTGDGSTTVHAADVTWRAESAPVQMADGNLDLVEGGNWHGVWQLQFEGFDPAMSEGRIFNMVEIQPDLQVTFSDGTGDRGATGLNLRDDGFLQLTLVDRDGNQRALEGSAAFELSLTRSDSGEKVLLADDLDISSGQVDVPLTDLGGYPVVGSVEARTSITTAGVDGIPGTALSPVVNTARVTVTQRDMPQLPGAVNFQATEETISVEVPVTGPGRIWIEPGSRITGTLPDGVDSISVSSAYSSPENALDIGLDEQATLPIEISVSELTDGLVHGVLPISISNPEGGNTTAVDIPTEGSLSVPVNVRNFAVAFIVALLLAILIPLVILYVVRWLTSRFADSAMAAVRIPLEINSGTVSYTGVTVPDIMTQTTKQNEVALSAREINAAGYQVKITTRQLNPFAPASAVVEHEPSVSGDGKQTRRRAKLPTAVQGSWFITADSDPNRMDLIVLPHLPADVQEITTLVNDITRKAPELVKRLQQQLADVPPAASGRTAGKSSRKKAQPVENATQTPPDAGQPQSGTQFGAGGFGGGSGGTGGFGGGFGSGNTGGFGSGSGGIRGSGEQGGSDGFNSGPDGGFGGGFGAR